MKDLGSVPFVSRPAQSPHLKPPSYPGEAQHPREQRELRKACSKFRVNSQAPREKPCRYCRDPVQAAKQRGRLDRFLLEFQTSARIQVSTIITTTTVTETAPRVVQRC